MTPKIPSAWALGLLLATAGCRSDLALRRDQARSDRDLAETNAQRAQAELIEAKARAEIAAAELAEAKACAQLAEAELAEAKARAELREITGAAP